MIFNNFFKNSFWVIGSKLFQTALTAFIGIYITRNLLPINFAVFASIQAVIGILVVLINFGFSYLIVQVKDSEKYFSSIFLFQTTLSIFIYFVSIQFLKPFLSYSYNLPEIESVFNLLALNIIIISLGSTPKAIINKQENFKYYSKLELYALITSSCGALFLIIQNKGIYALIIPSIYREAFISFFLISKTKKLLFNKLVAFKLSISNVHLISSQFINNLILNIQNYSLSVFFSPQILGYFNRAKSLENLFSSNIAISLGTVSFPYLVSIQNKNLLVLELKKMLKMVFLFSFPVLLSVAFFSNDIVDLLFGDQWISSSIFLKFLCIAGIPVPINHILSGLILSKGKFDYIFRINLLNMIAHILVFLILPLFFDIQAIYISLILIQIFLSFLYWISTKRLINFGFKEFLQSIFKLIFIGLIGIFLTSLFPTIIAENSIINLTIKNLFFIVFYFTFSFILDEELFDFLKSIFQKFNPNGS